MYNKIYSFCVKLIEFKSLFILITIFTVLNLCISCTYITINNKWGNLSNYPEDVYQSLENDINNVIQNFKSDYNLIITRYDNQENELNFELSSKSSKIDVYVYNYKHNNQKIEIKRNINSHIEQFLKNIFSLFLVSLLIALLEVLVILVGTFVIMCISSIIAKITSHKI